MLTSACQSRGHNDADRLEYDVLMPHALVPYTTTIFNKPYTDLALGNHELEA